jgi:acetylglutamate kinase
VEDIHLFKQALPYLKQYRDTVFVIKLGGELLTDRERLDLLASDLSVLYELNVRIVIIHGGGPQLSETAEKLGIVSEKIEGRRITDDRMLEVAKMVFAGTISTDILAHLRRHGCPGVGMTGVDGDLILATRRPKKVFRDAVTGEEREIDFQNVGDIRAVQPRILSVLLEHRFVPVICSLGADADGQVLNINADTIACEIASKLQAEKLFILTNVNGVLRDLQDPESRYSYLTVEQGEQLMQTKVISGGMSPKLSAAIRAVRQGVKRAYIVNGMRENALLFEVFTRKGLGTMIINKEEEAAYLQQG